MVEFKLKSDYTPKGDQPNAIKQLIKGITDNKKFQTLLGATGTGKTYTMANIITQINVPTLVMAPNKLLAAQLYQEFKDFFPKIVFIIILVILIIISQKRIYRPVERISRKIHR